MPKKNQRLIKTVVFLILLIAGRYLILFYGIPWINYEKPEIIKAEVKDYLKETYNLEFTIEEPSYEINSWGMYATPISNQQIKAYIKWSKFKTPHVAYDSYLNEKWRVQALPEAEAYFKKLYGDETQIFFLFQCMDEAFLKTEAAKSMDYRGVIKRGNQWIEVQCYLISSSSIDRDKEARKVEQAVREYLDVTATAWDYQVFYLSEGFEKEFRTGFAKDFNFLRARDSIEYKKMHDNGQIIEWYSLSRQRDEQLFEIRPYFFFENQ